MGIGHSYLKKHVEEVDSGELTPKPNNFSSTPTNHEGECSFVTDENNQQLGQRITPGGHIMGIVDPRSPNVEISRTPIVVTGGNSANKPGRKLLDQIRQNKGDGVTPTGVKTFPAGFDPRSPTEEIKRTPIKPFTLKSN